MYEKQLYLSQEVFFYFWKFHKSTWEILKLDEDYVTEAFLS